MKKGFTLIELLTVIVILSIIAMITVPIVNNINEDVKKNAFKRSIEQMQDVAILDYNEYARSNEVTYKYDNNELVCVKCNKGEDLKLDFTGEIEKGCGTLTVKSGKVTSVNIKNNKYQGTLENGKIVISNSDNGTCDF